MTKRTIRDYDVARKRILVRTALNVPIKDGVVGDRLRLQDALPTLNYLLERDASLILISHHSTKGMSLAPVAPIMAELLRRPVTFLPDCVGKDVQAAAQALTAGQVLMLENLRFHPEEEANDPGFAQALASLATVYVDDDFTTAHRPHASMIGVPKYLPAVAGLQLEKEVDTLTQVLENPQRPLLAVLGGAKISEKVELLEHLLTRVDDLVIGGAMANTFLAAQGLGVGQSLVELDQLDSARRIIAAAAGKGVRLQLPVDVVVTDQVVAGAKARTVAVAEVGERDIIADLGPETIDRAADLLGEAKTVIWNGPLGVTEYPEFAAASLALAHQIAESEAKSILGGGDTAAFIDAAGLHDQFDFISTGGGAALALMAGETLPAVTALLDK